MFRVSGLRGCRVRCLRRKIVRRVVLSTTLLEIIVVIIKMALVVENIVYNRLP